MDKKITHHNFNPFAHCCKRKVLCAVLMLNDLKNSVVQNIFVFIKQRLSTEGNDNMNTNTSLFFLCITHVKQRKSG